MSGCYFQLSSSPKSEKHNENNSEPAKGVTFIFSRYTKNEQAGDTFATNQVFLSFDLSFRRGGDPKTGWLYGVVAENRRDPCEHDDHGRLHER